jgi:hypothetical protein
MDAALDSHFDLDSMYTYSPASKCSSALPHQPSQPPRHDQYEISGLARIFHTDHLRKPRSQMDTASASNYSSGSVYTHSRLLDFIFRLALSAFEISSSLSV